MRKTKPVLVILGIVAAFVVAGCGDEAPSMTKAQEDAIKHPQANANNRAPNADEASKMGAEIAKYNEQHKNDKVEFNTGGK